MSLCSIFNGSGDSTLAQLGRALRDCEIINSSSTNNNHHHHHNHCVSEQLVTSTIHHQCYRRYLNFAIGILFIGE